MNYYLVLGSTNAVIDYTKIYSDKDSAVQAVMSYTYGDVIAPLASDSTLVNFEVDGVIRRALYLTLTVEEAKIKDALYVLVRSVPYLHSTTGARIFYDEQTAKAQVHDFNAALSRANFHAYLFTFPVASNETAF